MWRDPHGLHSGTGCAWALHSALRHSARDMARPCCRLQVSFTTRYATRYATQHALHTGAHQLAARAMMLGRVGCWVSTGRVGSGLIGARTSGGACCYWLMVLLLQPGTERGQTQLVSLLPRGQQASQRAGCSHPPPAGARQSRCRPTLRCAPAPPPTRTTCTRQGRPSGRLGVQHQHNACFRMSKVHQGSKGAAPTRWQATPPLINPLT